MICHDARFGMREAPVTLPRPEIPRTRDETPRLATPVPIL